MSPESISNASHENFNEVKFMQQFMEVEVAVLSKLFGDDEKKWEEWLNVETEHGERLRELVTGCYFKDGHTFSRNCVNEVVDVLRHDLENKETTIH